MEHTLVIGETICKSDETDSSDSEGEDEIYTAAIRDGDSSATVVPVRYNTSRCAFRYENGI
jgi:hypothetical protein